jgi:hypothetical protein
MAFAHLRVNERIDAEKHMIRGIKIIRIIIAAVAIICCVAVPAFSQGFSKMGKGSGPPVENHPKVDEKAYKAALERIPEPKQKYDPWGNARPSEPAKANNESIKERP